MIIVAKDEPHKTLLQDVINFNNFEERTEIILHSQIFGEQPCELIQSLKNKLDGIISDWVGNMLFNTRDILDVIHLRDNYLKKDGVIIPDSAKLQLASINDRDFYDERFKFWSNVYGYKMSIMKELHYKEIVFDYLDKDLLNSHPYTLFYLDLNTIKLAELNFIRSYQLQAKFSDRVNAFAFWFNIQFTKGVKKYEYNSGVSNDKENYQ